MPSMFFDAKQQVRAGRDVARIFHHSCQEIAKDRTPPSGRVGIAEPDDFCAHRVAPRVGVENVDQHVADQIAHSSKTDRRVERPHPTVDRRRTPRNVLREIADAFEVSGNTHGPEDLAQISGDWLAARDRQNRRSSTSRCSASRRGSRSNDCANPLSPFDRAFTASLIIRLAMPPISAIAARVVRFPVKRYDGMIAHHPLRIMDAPNGTSPRGIFHFTTSAIVLPAGNSKSRYRFSRRICLGHGAKRPFSKCVFLD